MREAFFAKRNKEINNNIYIYTNYNIIVYNVKYSNGNTVTVTATEIKMKMKQITTPRHRVNVPYEWIKLQIYLKISGSLDGSIAFDIYSALACDFGLIQIYMYVHKHTPTYPTYEYYIEYKWRKIRNMTLVAGKISVYFKSQHLFLGNANQICLIQIFVNFE